MSTTSYGFTDPAVLGIGRWTVASAFGRTGIIPQTCPVEFWLKATGTDCSIGYYEQYAGPAWEASVDGGSFADLTNPATGSWSDMTVFTGLSDSQHTVIVRKKGTNVQGAYYAFDEAAFVKVTGASPSLAAPDAGVNWYPIASGRLRNAGRVEGLIDWDYHRTYGSPTGYGGGWTPTLNVPVTGLAGASATFRAKTGKVGVYAVLQGQAYTLVVDGTPQSQVYVANTSAFGYAEIATGLDSANEHEYELVCSDGNKPYLGLAGIVLSGAGVQDHTYYPRGKLIVYGDSISVGVRSNSDQSTETTMTWAWKLARATNRELVVRAISGKSLTANTLNGEGCGHWSDEGHAYGSYPSRDVVVSLWGANDIQSGLSNTTVFQKAMEYHIRSELRSNVQMMLVLQCLESTVSSITTNRAAYGTAASNAVAALGGAPVYYLDTTGAWTTSNSADGLHPDDTGHTQVKDFVQASAHPVPTFAEPSFGGGGGVSGARIFTGF